MLCLSVVFYACSLFVALVVVCGRVDNYDVVGVVACFVCCLCSFYVLGGSLV